MAVSAQRVDVGVSATRLVHGNHSGIRIVLRNGGPVDVALGGPQVTAESGFALPAGSTLTLDLNAGEELFGIAVATSNIHVLGAGW